MWPSARRLVPSLLLAASLASAVINQDGSQSGVPAKGDNDLSPIDNIISYDPNQHQCPLPCIDYANIHSWVPYLSVGRLHRCEEPMLLQFSITQPLNDPTSNILIRSCTLGSRQVVPAAVRSVEKNPKRSNNLVQRSVDSASACAAAGKEEVDKLQVLTASSTSTNTGRSTGDDDVSILLEGMRKFFNAQDNCNENFLFSYHKRTAMSIYIGEGLGKPTVESVLNVLAGHLQTSKFVGHPIVAQLCGSGRLPEQIFGIAIDTTGNLAAVQKTALEWSKGNCARTGDFTNAKNLSGIKIWSLASSNNVFLKRSPSRFPALMSRFLRRKQMRSHPVKRAAAPKPNADGTCATHLVKSGDTCDTVAKQYDVTASKVEKWNKDRTWAWIGCKDMLVDNKICVSKGRVHMPPLREGAQCGPLVPGTMGPANDSISLADLNPCPLNACCNNLGERRAGGKKKGFETTCISNCGNKIKKNSGPPKDFQRIGYYQSDNLERDCLWLQAKDANTDGTYTHIHWSFAEIDPKTWKVVIKDPSKQWKDFKSLKKIKRIVSFGGWDYSTHPKTYNIIRSAILKHRNTFADNLARFIEDEGIDGVDIDWEHPALDILVDGKAIGHESDGVNYLKFLKILKKKVGSKKLVSIAAPESYWYLKEYPIGQIAESIDYIVYMTYDLHGQWNYGNSNAFDSCPSGKCVRSHVNLTETSHALSMITKAGVANNKIFVGEASFGRSLRMAKNDCWGPMCEFTGSKTKSDAQPGRCTNSSGLLAYAEITEIIQRSSSSKMFHDHASNSDIMLDEGDYVSYMSPVTKRTRRKHWKSNNFAGTIDWALDLQSFTAYEKKTLPKRPASGIGCISGEDTGINSGELCEFSCQYGLCPEYHCTCTATGKLPDLPKDKKVNAMAWDEKDVEMNRLCKFSCKYGECPKDICEQQGSDDEVDIPDIDDLKNEPGYLDEYTERSKNSHKCVMFQKYYNDPKYKGLQSDQCYKPCEEVPGVSSKTALGTCLCDHYALDFFAETFLEALPAVAQIGCYILMSVLKLVVDLASTVLPPAGEAVKAGLEIAMTAAHLAAHTYDKDQDPAGAFEWWLHPCGGSDLVPDELRTAFDILNQGPGRQSSRRQRVFLRGGVRRVTTATLLVRLQAGEVRREEVRKAEVRRGSGNPPNGVNKKCKIPKGKESYRLGEALNTLRMQACVMAKTERKEIIITSLVYAENAKPTQVKKECKKKFSQACFHYSSVIRSRPEWATLVCPQEAAKPRYRLNGAATKVWSDQHTGGIWKDPENREWPEFCDRDEYPPAYLMDKQNPAHINSGKDAVGQLVRYVPNRQNQDAGKMWKGACFQGPVKSLSNKEIKDRARGAPASHKKVIKEIGLEQTMVAVTVDTRPEFTISSWGHSGNPPPNDGLNENPCWPSGLAAEDPGFVLLEYDPYYKTHHKPYNYAEPYKKGENGS
ncbi:hypothetical protein ACJ72_03545 [Emergomyces africanus]|uniref:chitinase n=1 Tax=Emergomyces africanus TaxID=1955775 RepID=A0A1B7NZA0_9EURO|nr:hypothetical protein ACJ72_03545 [Emergomyces africanus]